MSRKSQIEERTEEILKPITEEAGLSIYDVEYIKEAGNWYLRAYIDKPDGGVSIDDCVNVSHALSDALDDEPEDFIEEAYTLEVSSPGLGRTLKKDRQLQMSIGEKVVLKTYKPVDGCKQFEGILKSFDNENIVIESGDADRSFVRKEISVVKLAFE